MSGRRRAEVLAIIVLGGFIVAVAAHYMLAFYQGRLYPFSTFLFRPSDRFASEAPGFGNHIFGDLYGTWQHTKDGSPYLAPGVFYPSNYLPAAHLLLKPLSWFSYRVAAGIFLIGCLVGVIALFWRRIDVEDRLTRSLLTLVLGCLTYPVLFALDRGNVDLLVFFALWAMLELIVRGRWMWAAAALSVAASMKGIPAVFVLLFLQARQWRAIALTVAMSLGLTLTALAIMEGGIVDNVEALRASLRGFDAASTHGTQGLQHVSTVAGLLGVVEHFVGWASGLAHAAPVISASLLCVIITATMFLPLELWERLTLLTVAAIIVPTVSYDYRLTLILLPILLVLSEREAPRLPMTVLVLFGLLLVPKGLPVLWADVGLGSFANPLLMLGLVGVVSSGGIRRWRSASRALVSTQAPA